MKGYERKGETLSRDLPVGEQLTVTLRAGDVHRERTGVHAKLEIACNGVVLAWGVINTDKDEDRVRLTNSAGRQLNNGQGELYQTAYLKKDVDDFCRGLWEAEIGRFEPELLEGLPPRPPDPMLKPYVIRGGGTILFAPPGRGKSWTTLLWSVSMDAGVSNLWPVHQAKVLLINLERSGDSVRRRIGAVNVALGLPRMRPLAILNARGRSLNEVLASAKRYVERESIQCVVLDSISRAGMGDLTENLAANRIVDQLNRLADTWVGIAHTPRSNDGHVYGSVHFDAAADVIVKLNSQQEADRPLGIGMEITKANDLPRSWWQMQTIALEMDDEQGLVEARKGRHGEFSELESGRQMTAGERLAEWVLDQPMGRATATQAADGLNITRGRASQLFTTDARFVVVGREGHSVFYGVTG